MRLAVSIGKTWVAEEEEELGKESSRSLQEESGCFDPFM